MRGLVAAKDCSVSSDTRLDLHNAILLDTYLSGVDLGGADLQIAILGGATLIGVDLTDANLTNADLSYTNLTRAKYSAQTRFPPNFDPKAAGMVLTTDQPAKGR